MIYRFHEAMNTIKFFGQFRVRQLFLLESYNKMNYEIFFLKLS